MRVRIVCDEDVHAWILGKFALKMNKCLLNSGIQSDIARQPDSSADINHYIVNHIYDGKKHSTDTLMITHVDNLDKLHQLKKQMDIAALGICMSRETLDNLVKLGLPRNKLSYINPAHDGVIIPRPKVIGITCRVYKDGRKREQFLSKLAKDIDSRFFSFKIMGDGWNNQVEELRKNGFQVEYINHFDYNKYVKLIPSLDYYLYMGQDEGQVGFIDALTAGVETIITPQGYHLDAAEGISYPFNTYCELLNTFKVLTDKRLKLINSVSTWNWKDYTIKHLEIWEYLLSQKKDIFTHTSSDYLDGIYSLEKFDKKHINESNTNKWLKLKLFCNNLKHAYCAKRKKIGETVEKDGYRGLCQALISKATHK